MFDIGFFELILIAIVGLVVIGPERLPETIKTISLWIGRLRRSLRETRAELEQQIGADEIRRQLHNEEVMRNLNATREQIERVMNDDPLELPDVDPSHFTAADVAEGESVRKNNAEPRGNSEEPPGDQVNAEKNESPPAVKPGNNP